MLHIIAVLLHLIFCMTYDVFHKLDSAHNFAQEKKDTGGVVAKEPADDTEKRLNRAAVITISATRKLIESRLKKQMKEKGFYLTSDGNDVLVFCQRTPGATAAVKRRGYNHTTMTPIVDDPKIIMAFGVAEKGKSYLIVGRFAETFVLPTGVVETRDLTDEKESRIKLNTVLEKLKAEVDGKEPTKN